MEKDYNFVIDHSILSTPQPTATSTIDRKKFKSKEVENLIDLTSSTCDSDESLGIISIKSDELSPYIDNLQLKESKRGVDSYADQQRTLAGKTLHNRESRISSLPSRFLRPSEVSSIADSCINISNGSTVSESDLLKQTGINNTSTPRTSLLPSPSMHKIDIAESMARMSHEIRNSGMSLSTALQKMDEEYRKVRNSISVQSDMFKPAEEVETQLLTDEASWKREKELPADKVDFSVDNLNTSNMSISAFFKQRSEDISNIIPSGSRKSSMITDIPRISSDFRKSSLTSIPSLEVSSSSENEMTDTDMPQRESLSISTIAQILQDSKETPTKVLDYLLKQCPGGQKMYDGKNLSRSHNISAVKEGSQKFSVSPTSSVGTDTNSGNFHYSNFTSDKENFNSMNVPQQRTLGKMSSNISKSLTSLRSTSSLSNLPGGKLPIETTHCELVWGCVRAGKSETKQFTLRNRSSNKLRIQCTISGPLFRIVQERAEDSANSIKLMLHAHETKSISVIFNPLTDGAVADEIVFSPCDPSLQQTRKQSIQLFGYGGTGFVEFKNNILKDGAGRHWLSLGNILGKSIASETITIFNKGTLPAFAFFDYVPKDFAFSNVSVTPNTLILAPKEQKEISISCMATREDIKYLQNCVTTSVNEIGVVKIISGPEAIRARIRRLCKLAMERNLELDILSTRLSQEIHGETISADVVKCRESINSMKSLLQGLLQREVVIMLEKDMDCTLVPSLTEETSMFQSLYQESTLIEKTIKNHCKLEPSSLILTPPSKLRDYFFLISESESSLRFEISVPIGVEVTPQSDYLMPHATKAIELQIKKIDDVVQNGFSVSVNVAGDILEMNVKIIFI